MPPGGRRSPIRAILLKFINDIDGDSLKILKALAISRISITLPHSPCGAGDSVKIGVLMWNNHWSVKVQWSGVFPTPQKKTCTIGWDLIAR